MPLRKVSKNVDPQSTYIDKLWKVGERNGKSIFLQIHNIFCKKGYDRTFKIIIIKYYFTNYNPLK